MKRTAVHKKPLWKIIRTGYFNLTDRSNIKFPINEWTCSVWLKRAQNYFKTRTLHPSSSRVLSASDGQFHGAPQILRAGSWKRWGPFDAAAVFIVRARRKWPHPRATCRVSYPKRTITAVHSPFPVFFSLRQPVSPLVASCWGLIRMNK